MYLLFQIMNGCICRLLRGGPRSGEWGAWGRGVDGELQLRPGQCRAQECQVLRSNSNSKSNENGDEKEGGSLTQIPEVIASFFVIMIVEIEISNNFQ